MPQGIRMNEADAAMLNTAGATVIYGITLSDWVLIGWLVYIAVITAIKLPDLVAKYPILGRLLGRVRSLFRRGRDA